MKIGSPKNLEGKNLLVGVSAVDSNGNAIGSDITTLKNGANVTFTSSANGVLVINAESVASGGGSVTSASNATITLMQGGVVKGSFTLNQPTNSTIALDAGGGSVTSAVYATNDKNGNDISTTYQTIINNDNKLNGAYVSGAVAYATSAANVKDSVIKMQLNGVTVDSFTLNQGTSKVINYDGVAMTSDLNSYATALDFTIDSSSYVVSAVLKNGTTVLTSKTIILPLGAMVTAAQEAKTAAEAARDDAQSFRNQTQVIYETVKTTVATYYVGPAYNYGVTVDGTMLSFTWTDPADNNVVKWARTRLVMKQGGFPANESDGTVLIDVTERNQHKTVPFTWDAGVISDYYFALFTQTTGDVWYTGDDCPRFTTDELTWATIVMMSRAGTLLQYPGMEIGSVVDKKVKDLYPKLRYRLADIDYSGSFEKVSDFMYDNTRTHNSIWIPYFLPSLGEGNSQATMMQFDALESSYGATWDEVFVPGKAYYTVKRESYTKLWSGTDYQDGENIAEWQTLHSDTVYTKNHADRVKWGNNIWKESNMRQWLNSTGNDWFQKQNEYDVLSKNTDYSSGWMTDFVPGFLELVQPVYNKTSRNTVPAIEGGGGGGYDITLDKFWLLSVKEVFGTNSNNIAEGKHLAYFRDVATTDEQRVQYGEDGVYCAVWLRSPAADYARGEYCISETGVISNDNYANFAYAFQPVMCL